MQNNCTKYNSESLEKASGAIGIRMTNDYLFRALMQRNNKVLKAFICSLLHLTMKSVCTVEIKNPIELGKHIDDKDFFLDIKVQFNSDHTVINLEMQVLNEGNWPERSLVYLCRSFDSIKKEKTITKSNPQSISVFLILPLSRSIQIFATYWMTNEKSIISTVENSVCLC
ncbi:MAG: PD-(D/E)XK nuclease family transposase [Eubacterium sp.]